jgi:hypothetical protein
LKDGLEANRKLCLKQQTELRNKLLSADYYQEACQLFFKQHAMLHSVKMAQTEPWSLEDEVFDALSDEKARRIPCKMKIKVRDTGSTMDTEGVVDLSNKIDIVALRAYRVAVGRRTRDIVNQLQPEELKHKIDPARLDQVRKEGAVVEAASGLIDYWGKRNIAGLLLMPATRHNLVHLNESLRLKERRN